MRERDDMDEQTEDRGFLALARSRRSTRCFSSRPVETEALRRCLEAARLAPSACNAQPWRFIVAAESELVKKLAPACALPGSKLNRFVEGAPVIAAVIEESPNLTSFLGSLFKNRPLHLIDIGIAAEHFCLQAETEGLGTCMLGWFDERAVRRLLAVPRGKRVAVLIAVGYAKAGSIAQVEGGDAPAARGSAKKRKPMEEMSGWNRY